MKWEKNKRAQFYAAHDIKKESKSWDQVEDKRACVYEKKVNVIC